MNGKYLFEVFGVLVKLMLGYRGVRRVDLLSALSEPLQVEVRVGGACDPPGVTENEQSF